MPKPRLVLADDHQIVLEGLRGLLSDDFDLVGTAIDGRELLKLCLELDPDVVVADISMPLLNGIEVARQIREHGLKARVVFLTMHPDLTYATQGLAAGGRGYVLKHAASDELVTAIREALADRVFVSPALRTPAFEELLAGHGGNTRNAIQLTARQREVLQLLAEGKSAKEIAAVLEISSRTVETHKYKIMDDLGVRTTAELVHYAIRHGLVAR